MYTSNSMHPWTRYFLGRTQLAINLNIINATCVKTYRFAAWLLARCGWTAFKTGPLSINFWNEVSVKHFNSFFNRIHNFKKRMENVWTKKLNSYYHYSGELLQIELLIKDKKWNVNTQELPKYKKYIWQSIRFRILRGWICRYKYLSEWVKGSVVIDITIMMLINK